MNRSFYSTMKTLKNTDGQKPVYAYPFQHGIMTWNLEEGHWYSPERVEEELAIQETLAGTQPFALLVNASNNAVMDLECTERIIAHPAVHRKAVAIITGENLASRLMLNFYIQKCALKGTVRLFKSETVALSWLQEQLHKGGK